MSWPRTFHRIWFDEPERPRFAGWRDRLQELHPDWEIRTWGSSAEVRELLATEKLRGLWDRYLESDPFGRIPDIARYVLLHTFGGVYIDTDFEPLRSFDELLEDPRPFAAWENERTMCTALLASPPAHDAIGVLIDGLPKQLGKTQGKPANYAAGPEYATPIWRARDDVRRLPPWTFYPVGWWEKHMLGDPANYHPETYAVHHWAKGWGEERAQKIGTEFTTVILVPWRAGDPDRERAWEFVRRCLEPLGWPVVLGDSDGNFNRSAAVNAAAEGAGDWDVAVIIDADTVDDHAALEKAVEQAHAEGSAVVPWDIRWKLNQDASARVARVGLGRFNRASDIDRRDRTRPRGVAVRKRGGTIVVSRAAWDAVGGFDPGFASWGHEDRAFREAIATLAPGGLHSLPGVSYHLWHELASVDRKGSPEGRDRFARYTEASGNPAEMAALLREFGRL